MKMERASVRHLREINAVNAPLKAEARTLKKVRPIVGSLGALIAEISELQRELTSSIHTEESELMTELEAWCERATGQMTSLLQDAEALRNGEG